MAKAAGEWVPGRETAAAITPPRSRRAMITPPRPRWSDEIADTTTASAIAAAATIPSDRTGVRLGAPPVELAP